MPKIDDIFRELCRGIEFHGLPLSHHDEEKYLEIGYNGGAGMSVILGNEVLEMPVLHGAHEDVYSLKDGYEHMVPFFGTDKAYNRYLNRNREDLIPKATPVNSSKIYLDYCIISGETDVKQNGRSRAYLKHDKTKQKNRSRHG